MDQLFTEINAESSANNEHTMMDSNTELKLESNLAGVDTEQELLTSNDIKQEIINPNDELNTPALNIDLEIFHTGNIKQEVVRPFEQDTTNLSDASYESALNSEQKIVNVEHETESTDKTSVQVFKTNQKTIKSPTKRHKRKLPSGSSVNSKLIPTSDPPQTSPTDLVQKSSLPAQVNPEPETEYEGKTAKSIFQCKKCLKVCTRLQSLKLHERIHLNEPVNNYKCQHCNAAFDDASALKNHASQHIGERFTCKHCLFSCTRATSMRQHQRIHSEKAFKCKYCDNPYSDITNLKLHESGHIGQVGYVQIKCQRCSKCFDRETSLKVHSQIQNSRKGSKCSILCDKCFKDGSDLDKPAAKLTDENELKCKYCSKSFTMHIALKNHEREHTGEKIKKPLKSYRCLPCGKLFKDVANLINHAKIHTTSEKLKWQETLPKKIKKSHQCMYCGKLFTKLCTVKEHEMIHTGEKPFKCFTCGASFSRSSRWKEHERRHIVQKPFKCEYCNKRFWRKTYLINHKRLHTGDKPYPCQYCGKKFNSATHRTQHERVHTGEKPYKCKYCDKTFRQQSNKREHEKIHTQAGKM